MHIDSDQLVNVSRLRPDQDEISLRVPALRRYVGSVRGLTTGLAAQCDLTIDEIEDVQMSIDEVCALLLPHVERSQPWLDVRFHVVQAHFFARVVISTARPVQLDRTDLSWTVLTALSDEPEIHADGRSLGISFTKLGRAGRR